MNDMGTALLLYGIFLAMVYTATGRNLYTVVGIALFAAGSWFVYQATPHVQERFTIWLDPWKDAQDTRLPDHPVDRIDRRRRRLRRRPGPQLPAAAERHAGDPRRADGRHLRRLGQRDRAGRRGGAPARLPAVRYRGFKTATLAEDGFSKLLATGLTFAFGLQAFLIVGGVTRLIPLTGITLPFVSYGGSSIVSNFALLAMLLMVSDRAHRGRRT